MREFQCGRMQEVSRQRKRGWRREFSAWAGGLQFARGTIERVANYGVAEGQHVNADLVSAAGVDSDFDQRELTVGRFNAANQVVVRDSLAAPGVARRHPGAAYAIAADAG